LAGASRGSLQTPDTLYSLRQMPVSRGGSELVVYKQDNGALVTLVWDLAGVLLYFVRSHLSISI